MGTGVVDARDRSVVPHLAAFSFPILYLIDVTFIPFDTDELSEGRINDFVVASKVNLF